MEKLNSKKKIAVFISGRGSNLKNLINYSKLKKSSFKVCLVLSNKSNAKGLKYAKIKISKPSKSLYITNILRDIFSM